MRSLFQSPRLPAQDQASRSLNAVGRGIRWGGRRGILSSSVELNAQRYCAPLAYQMEMAVWSLSERAAMSGPTLIKFSPCHVVCAVRVSAYEFLGPQVYRAAGRLY